MTTPENDLVRTLSLQPGAQLIECDSFDLEFIQRSGDERDRDGVGKLTLFIPALPEHVSDELFLAFGLEASEDGENFFPVGNPEELYGGAGGTPQQELDLVLPKGISRFVRPIIRNPSGAGIRGQVKVVLQLRDPAFKGLVSAATRLVEMERQFISEREAVRAAAQACTRYGFLRDQLAEAMRTLVFLNSRLDERTAVDYAQFAHWLDTDMNTLSGIIDGLASRDALLVHRARIVEAFTARTVTAAEKALADFVKENRTTLKEHGVI